MTTEQEEITKELIEAALEKALLYMAEGTSAIEKALDMLGINTDDVLGVDIDDACYEVFWGLRKSAEYHWDSLTDDGDETDESRCYANDVLKSLMYLSDYVHYDTISNPIDWAQFKPKPKFICEVNGLRIWTTRGQEKPKGYKMSTKALAVRNTCTNGNAINGIRGSRIRYWDADGNLIGQQVVSCHYGVYYCLRHPTGKYGVFHRKMWGWE